MERSPSTTDRPSYKLLRKFAPSYWAGVRRVRSQESIPPRDSTLKTSDIQSTLVSSFTSFQYLSANPRQIQSPIYGTALQVEVNIEGNCTRHPTDRMPFPMGLTASQDTHASIHSQRKSSVNREAFIHQRRTDNLQHGNDSAKSPKTDQKPTQDETSQRFDAFDDDLLQPEQNSQVAKMASLFPAPARSRYVKSMHPSSPPRLCIC